MKTGKAITVGLLALAIGLAAPLAMAQEFDLPINMRGNAGAQTRGRTTMVDISITEWTTSEERQALIEFMKQEGTLGLNKRLQEESPKGRINPRGQMGINWRYAYQFPKDGGVTIILAADRPLNVGQAIDQGAVSRAHNITLAVIELDEKGNGAGSLVLGAELSFGADGKLEVTGAGQNAVHVGGLRVLK